LEDSFVKRLYSLALTASLVGAAASHGADDEFRVRTIGDFTAINGMEAIRVEGIGLVVGLRGKGGDPPPGPYREQILQIMRKHDVEQAEKLLASKDVAVVLLRAFVPPGIRKGEPVDVEVYCIPGDNATTSLKGGTLLPTTLREKVVAKGNVLDGIERVTVDGPMLVSEPTGANKEDAGLAKSAKILGRGKVKQDRDFIVTINREHRSGRMAKEIANHINSRFFVNRTEGEEPKGVANAKDAVQVHLAIPREYRNNIVRYLHVARRIPFKTSASQRLEYIRELKQRLLDPARSYDAALALEALGPTAVPHLKDALEDRSQIVRFSAAEALAYLGDIRGVSELGNLAESEALYRPYAIAALTVPRFPVARLRLLRLLHAPGAETRYGAFRALWSVDPDEPTIHGEPLGEDGFLHEVASTAEPMIHVARHFRPEIVVFGKRQTLSAPVLLHIGDRFVVQHLEQGQKILLTSIEPGREPVREECSAEVSDVLRKAAKIGAKYPELVELLRQASANGNLQGRLEFNALPRAASIAQVARGAADEADQLPTEVPSLFAAETSETKAKAALAEADPNKDKTEEPAKPKKPWWKRPFSFFGN
jgi:flagellar basal body P-ring protein FlgI